MVATSIFDNFIEVLTCGDPVRIAAFRAARQDQERMDYLLEKQKENTLNAEEMQEHERWMMLVYLARLAKSKARVQLQA